MNEWGFAGEIKSWWDSEFLAHHEDWRLERCELEKREEQYGKRSDLVVWGQGQVVLAGELRLPDHPVASPAHVSNLEGALQKAGRLGARWAFTSDGVRLLLLDRSLPGRSYQAVVDDIALYPFESREELENPLLLANVQTAWREGLSSVVPTILGRRTPPGVSPDDVFIRSLRAVLDPAVRVMSLSLNTARQAASFEKSIIRWMVERQGWAHDAAHWDQELLRTARLTAYVFATRLLFYEALRRTNPELAQIELPSTDADTAQRIMKVYFDSAREKSGDYETLFLWDEACDFALISDECVLPWKRAVDQLSQFRLNEINYDILGKLFERLIDPQERYEWGQHYTKSEVVDLMLSFALPDGSGTLLDPAVGSGTFLVRAYDRKARNQAQTHQQRLSELFGTDISALAASITTVNLAIRDLNFSANYPQVAARSFFALDPHAMLMRLPVVNALGLTEGQTRREVLLDRVSAVACNPPYVRVHELSNQAALEAQEAIRRPLRPVQIPNTPAGLANYHVYFWLHAAQFLDNDGRLAFITAGQWLDAGYGTMLKKWLLDHFQIEVCIESLAETWFTEARVGTVVLVAKRCADQAQRSNTVTRFVMLRQRLHRLYAECESGDPADQIRDAILALAEGTAEGEQFDHITVRQADLDASTPWRSRFLRSPKAAIAISLRPDFVRLDALAAPQLGLKTGADDFFFLKLTEARGRAEAAAHVRVEGRQGWVGSIRRSHVHPALQNPEDLRLDDGRRMRVPQRTGLVYLYPPARQPSGDLREYVKLAELDNVHEQQLVRQNASPRGLWFRQRRPLITSRWVLPYNSAYDYGAWDNSLGAVLNGRFVGVSPFDGTDDELLGAVLNSTFTICTRLLVGLATGTEGAFDVGPPAAAAMRIPDLRKFTARGAERVRRTFRGILDADRMLPAPDEQGAVEELRRQLDLEILVALGDRPGDAALTLDGLYASYARWRSSVREVELEMRVHRRAMGASGQTRGATSVTALAERIWDELRTTLRIGNPFDALADVVMEEVDIERDFIWNERPDLFGAGVVREVGGRQTDLGSPERARYAVWVPDIPAGDFRIFLPVPGAGSGVSFRHC